MTVEFCLGKWPFPCLGISLSDREDDLEFINLQTKGRNVSKSQLEWTFSGGVLRPFLYNYTYVAVNKDGYLVLTDKGPPVFFVNGPRFRSVDGLCVVAMKCERNLLGFCSRTSTERATHLARGAMVKLLPCLKSSLEWTVTETPAPTTEYEETLTPTLSPSFSPSFFPSVSPSSFPSLSPSRSPSLSPRVSSPTTVSPTSSPLSFFPVTPSPTSFENQTALVLVGSSPYVGLVALVIVVAVLCVIYHNCRGRPIFF